MHPVFGVRRKPGLPWCMRTGVRPPAGTALVLLVAGCFFRRQSSVQRHVRPLLFSVSHFSCSIFFSGLPTICRGAWFSSLLGSMPAFAPVELAFTFFPSSRAMMGLELGLYAHILGSAILSQFARFPRHVAFLRLRLGFVGDVLPSCSEG